MWLMTVLKASLSSYRLVNTKKSISAVRIERRIPAAANLMTISHSYWEISPVKLHTCGDYNIDLLHCKEPAELKYSNDFRVGENRVVLESKEIANHFNKFFVDIGTNLSNLIEPCPGTKPTDFVKSNVSQSMYIHPVTEQEVLDIVSGCKSKSSYGHDEISMKTVKHVIKQIVKPLNHIFNRSLICESFRNDMKLAKIIPVFKSGDRFKL